MAVRLENPAGYPVELEEFLEQGLIREPITIIKAGKEATAYLTRGTMKLGARWAVAKVYHERTRRNFANDAMYQEGRVILDARARRSAASRTEFGRVVQRTLWVDHEFEVLSELQYAGADVPAPYAATESAILLEFIGELGMPAPQLQHAEVAREEAEALLERLVWNVQTFLRSNRVHGDLSAFNVLYDRGRCWVIDFPQAVDARTNPHARRLLERDLTNLARYFARYGIALDADGAARRMWERWRYGEL